jgi:hypothetical protein
VQGTCRRRFVKELSGALLFKSPDADCKLEPFMDLPVLEVTELFVDAVFLSDGCIFQTVIDRRSNERARQKQASEYYQGGVHQPFMGNRRNWSAAR